MLDRASTRRRTTRHAPDIVERTGERAIVRTTLTTTRVRETGGTASTTMASIIARCVPGSYDTLEDAAKGLAHATLACALLGTVGFLGTGYCAGIVAMQCLVLSAMANRNASLLKVGGARGRATTTTTTEERVLRRCERVSLLVLDKGVCA